MQVKNTQIGTISFYIKKNQFDFKTFLYKVRQRL